MEIGVCYEFYFLKHLLALKLLFFNLMVHAIPFHPRNLIATLEARIFFAYLSVGNHTCLMDSSLSSAPKRLQIRPETDPDLTARIKML
jgi:hypothetical protein